MDNEIDKFNIIFAGTRGSTAYNAKDMMKYGCNTPCVGFQCGETIIVFDAGTGIVNINNYLKENQINSKLNIFFSHYHMDHLEGLMFCDFSFNDNVEIDFYGKTVKEQNCKEILDKMFSPPYFPIRYLTKERSKRFNFYEIINRERHIVNDVIIDNMPVHHPGGANSFRVTYKGKSVCYVCDYEFNEQNKDEIREFIDNSELVIFDASYTDDDFMQGWGHSTWRQGLTIIENLNVKKMALFHHSPKRTDYEIDEAQKEINLVSDKVIFANDGLIVNIN